MCFPIRQTCKECFFISTLCCLASYRRISARLQTEHCSVRCCFSTICCTLILMVRGSQAGPPGWDSKCPLLECFLRVCSIESFTVFSFIVRTDSLTIWTSPEMSCTGDLSTFCYIQSLNCLLPEEAKWKKVGGPTLL